MLGVFACAETALAVGRCFPPEARVDEFLTDWFCKQLAAAGEGRLGPHALYRFSHIPSFDPTRVAVVSMEGGYHFVVGKVLSGKGGYEPGRLVRTTKRVITPQELQLLEQRLENAEVWGPPFPDVRRGLDGAEWVFEGKKSGRYYFHAVWSPGSDFPQYRKAAAYMLELADIVPAEDDLY
jgi:hypothetical protein